MAEVGRLLRGDAAGVRDAIAAIDAAAARSDPDALERRALFEAVGYDRPQNWNTALDSLRDAADLGSLSAQQQMLILADGGSVAGAQMVDWSTIRAQISLERLGRVPEREVLSETPRVRIMRDFASPAECAWLIERARDRLQPAVVVNSSGSQTIEAARTNSGVEFQVADMDLVVETVRTRISAATRLVLPLFEPSQVLHYAVGQQFRPHHDYFDTANPGHAEQLSRGQRIATFLIYLNDDYAGGETDFPQAGVSFRGKTGDALFLANVDRSGRADPLSLHAGKPPTSGQKWIFSQWIRDRLSSDAARQG